MSLTEQIQMIQDGLFDNNFPPGDLQQVLSNGTQRAVNWRRIRPAVEALRQMSWYQVDSQWDFFLDPERYPVGRPMDLRPDEVGTFQDLVRTLASETTEGIRILSSVHPKISLTDVTVTIGSTDLKTLTDGIEHVRRTTELAAIDDAITARSLQPGSIEITLTAGQVSLLALQLAIVLASVWKDSQTAEKIGGLRRLWRRVQPDNNIEEETIQEVVLDDAREIFWQSASKSLENAVKSVDKHFPEAQSKINQAAKEIYEHSDSVSANWRLPPAVITGLPGDLAVSLNYNNPEAIGRVIRELASSPEDSATDR